MRRAGSAAGVFDLHSHMPGGGGGGGVVLFPAGRQEQRGDSAPGSAR